MTSAPLVLIVEPNAITRKLLAGILNKKGYESCEAATGAEALPFLKKDLQAVVIDVENDDPDLTGLLHQLQAEQPRLLVIAISDDVDAKTAAARLQVGEVALLRKPVMPEKLIRYIEDHIGGGTEKKRRHPYRCLKKFMAKKREGFMIRAIDLAQIKMDEGCGGPFGAVIVKGGKIIAEGWCTVTSQNDPTGHAEIMAIRNAGAFLKTPDLSGCEIYSSCEPCPMCYAALYWAKLDRIFFGCTREDADKLGFDDDFIYREMMQPDHKRSLSARIFMREDAKIVFNNWVNKTDKVTG